MAPMKCFMILILVFFFRSLIAQDAAQLEEVSYCGERLVVPEGCTALSEFEINCDNFSMQWMYLEPDMLTFAPQQYMGQLDEKLKRFKKKPINVVSRGEEIKAYQITYRENKQEKYKIIAFGTVNGYPVLLHISLANALKTNEDVPAFTRQIIAFKE